MNHNLETVPRLYKEARPGSDYAFSLNLLKKFKALHPGVPTKSGLMVSAAGITTARLWAVMQRFFLKVADVIAADSPATAEKLRRASPHWMRHTHATHALARGAELTTVRDNLRHASVSTTSIYLHGDEVKRARQMDAAFGARDSAS